MARTGEEFQVADKKAIDPLWVWGENADRPRLLHSMLRVRDVDATLRFYCDGLGMNLLDRYDFETGRFSILFLSYAGYRDGPAAIELTYNWDQDSDYTHGNGYGHIAIGVPDVRQMWARLADYGGRQGTAPKSMMPGAPELAFVYDPDGYAIELIQTKRSPVASA
jgi:lactoylglutathione lyase